MKKVTLQISDEFYEFANLRTEDDGYFGPEDYLNGLLNMALLSSLDEPGCLNELEEDPGGGMRVKSDREDDDLDDDIPF